jgi:hypothetical protein
LLSGRTISGGGSSKEGAPAGAGVLFRSAFSASGGTIVRCSGAEEGWVPSCGTTSELDAIAFFGALGGCVFGAGSGGGAVRLQAMGPEASFINSGESITTAGAEPEAPAGGPP